MDLYRDDLLAGVRIAVAGGAVGGLEGLGAEVVPLAVDPFGEEPDPVAAGALIWDARRPPAGVEGVRGALDGAWLAIRAAVATPGPDGQRIVLIAPAPGGPHAEAARAGLENLSRTLSIEWSRFGVRTLTVLPGAESAAEQVDALVAYAVSKAGDYFSGTALTLR